MLGQMITKDQLKDMGWSTAGGAAGFVGASFALPIIGKIPLLDRLPMEVHQAALGVVGGRLAWGWNREFACGLTGGLAGHAVARGLMRLVGGTLNLAAVEEDDITRLGNLPSAALPASESETEVVVDEEDLAGLGNPIGELEPAQSFQGGFGATVEEQAPLGSWIGA